MKLMKRRNLLLAILMAPFAALASIRGKSSEVSSVDTPARRSPVRVLYHPGTLSQECIDRIKQNWDQGVKADKLMVLDEGMSYHEFYGPGEGDVIVLQKREYAYSYEVDDTGKFFNFTGHPIDANGTITFGPGEVGKSLRVVIDPTLAFGHESGAMEARFAIRS
jgi:hypothetical protein